MVSATPTSATGDPPKIIIKKAANSADMATQTTFGCSHIKAMLQTNRQQAVDGYTKIMAVVRQKGNIARQHCKSPAGVYATCKVTYLCFQCATVNGTRDRHRPDHGFVVDSSDGHVYCQSCKDFVYDATLEAIRSPNTKKRKHAETLDDVDQKLVAANTTAIPCAATGLRGIYNMGQTCFMSVILQSLIHNPFLREYYLSEGHRSLDCEREICTSCSLDDMFNDFFGNEKHEGYGCVHMLQACWKGGGNLAGYAQQDAHEFLGFILNSLHEANAEDDEKKDTKDCDCIVHHTFGGMLKSTVTCTTCKNTTTALDPFMDLSLDVKNAGVSIKKRKLALINGTQTVKEVLPVDLTECLERFTSAETLAKDDYHCRKCDASREAKKKLAIANLPHVVPIHLKRFSHSKANSQSNKIDTRVRFPFSLDFSPYLTATESSKNDSDSKKTSGGSHKDDENGDDAVEVASTKESGFQPTEPVYELSSVIVHRGKIDSGHYISYAKQRNEWFRFDDSVVVQVDEKEVLGAEAYMLFYVLAQF